MDRSNRDGAHTIGTEDEISRWRKGQGSTVATFDTASVAALVETSPGELVYSDHDGRLLRRRGGHEDVIAEGLDRPGALAASGGEVLCLGAGGDLYRVTHDGSVWYVDLADIGFPDQYERLDPNRGLLSNDRDSAWVAAGGEILALDLKAANWVSFAGG